MILPSPFLEPVVLTMRRIYIVPTRFGLLFAGVSGLMLLGALNYNNNSALFFTALFIGAGLVTMVETWRNLLGLRIRFSGAQPALAGEPVTISFQLDNATLLPRQALRLRFRTRRDTPSDVLNLAPQQDLTVGLGLPSLRRGWLPVDSVEIYSEFPLGLFHAWSVASFNVRCLVYPHPGGQASPRHEAALTQIEGHSPQSGSDDFAGLRPYRLGDSPRHLNWKALARDRGWLIKQFTGGSPGCLWVDWEAVPDRDTEARISRLTALCLRLSQREIPFGFRIPGLELPPGQGLAHRERCLTALARFGESN
ncbi:hypothetical protein CCP4SC76_5330014 [Gammaproteobacteria bacterium]